MSYITIDEVEKENTTVSLEGHPQRWLPEVEDYVDEDIYYLMMLLNRNVDVPRTRFSCIECVPSSGVGYFVIGDDFEGAMYVIMSLLQEDILHNAQRACEIYDRLIGTAWFSDFDEFGTNENFCTNENFWNAVVIFNRYVRNIDVACPEVQHALYIPTEDLDYLNKAAKSLLTENGEDDD